MKRSERIGIILLILAQNPNQLFTLSHFAKQFGCAKSTLSEDMTEVKEVLERNHLGTLETVAGAAGGICYLPFRRASENLKNVEEICQLLCDPSRIMPGGFLYTIDLFSQPSIIQKMGMVLAQYFYPSNPDVIVTIESRGIPIGLMVAQAMSRDLVIVRKEHSATDGSVVTLNYNTTSSPVLRTMSLPRRLLEEGKRALIIDDFCKGGGTISGLYEMMREFHCEVVGAGTLIQMPSMQRKQENVVSLLELKEVDHVSGKIDLHPAEWLTHRAQSEENKDRQVRMI